VTRPILAVLDGAKCFKSLFQFGPRRRPGHTPGG
jgi:hypothetical protein